MYTERISDIHIYANLYVTYKYNAHLYGSMVRTTIGIEDHTRDKLREYGPKGVSYTDILEAMMKLVDEKGLKSEIMEKSYQISQVRKDKL